MGHKLTPLVFDLEARRAQNIPGLQVPNLKKF